MLLALATQLLAPLAALHAEAPDPGQYSAEQFEVKATRGNKAVMRDGVRLSVDFGAALYLNVLICVGGGVGVLFGFGLR
jgi:hypothetical protein